LAGLPRRALGARPRALVRWTLVADGRLYELPLGVRLVAGRAPDAPVQLSPNDNLVAFIAPDQLLGFRDVGPSGDVYSAACSLSYLLTGDLP